MFLKGSLFQQIYLRLKRTISLKFLYMFLKGNIVHICGKPRWYLPPSAVEITPAPGSKSPFIGQRFHGLPNANTNTKRQQNKVANKSVRYCMILCSFFRGQLFSKIQKTSLFCRKTKVYPNCLNFGFHFHIWNLKLSEIS